MTEHARLRLRDYFLGHTEPPPAGSGLDDLMRVIEEMDDVDPEEIARICRRGQVRAWERIEEMLREEKRRDG